MLPVLDALAELDQELARLDRVIEATRSKPAAARAAAAAAESTLAAVRARVETNRTATRVVEKQIAEHRSRKATAVRALEQGLGNPDAAGRQITSADTAIDEAETHQLELMEEADHLAREFAAGERAVAEAIAAVPVVTAAATSELADLRASREVASTRRAAAAASLPAEVREKYDLMRARRGTSVSRIEQGICRACRMAVAPQQEVEIASGLVHTCRGCGRWLVPILPKG